MSTVGPKHLIISWRILGRNLDSPACSVRLRASANCNVVEIHSTLIWIFNLQHSIIIFAIRRERRRSLAPSELNVATTLSIGFYFKVQIMINEDKSPGSIAHMEFILRAELLLQ